MAASSLYPPCPELPAPGKCDSVRMPDSRGALEPGGCSNDLFQRWSEEPGKEWGRGVGMEEGWARASGNWGQAGEGSLGPDPTLTPPFSPQSPWPASSSRSVPPPEWPGCESRSRRRGPGS